MYFGAGQDGVVISVENGMTVIIYDTVPATKFLIPVICALLLSTIIASVVLFQKLLQYNETRRCAILEKSSAADAERGCGNTGYLYGYARTPA